MNLNSHGIAFVKSFPFLASNILNIYNSKWDLMMFYGGHTGVV